MTTERKYIAKSFFFWLVRFLKLKYHTVDMVFIAHDTEAQIVPEQDFFTISKQRRHHVLLRIPDRPRAHSTDSSARALENNYVFHFSDGDNWHDDNSRCKALVTQLLDHVAMIGYGRFTYQDESTFYGWGTSFNAAWSTLHTELSTIAHPRFNTVAIKQKADVYQALQTFLGDARGRGASPSRATSLLLRNRR